MAKKRDNESFYGMRLVSCTEQFIGICCEATDMSEITLRFYHKKYGNYVYDDLKTFPMGTICTGETTDEALYNLKKIVSGLTSSSDIYLDEKCYEAICNYCNLNKKVCLEF